MPWKGSGGSAKGKATPQAPRQPPHPTPTKWSGSKAAGASVMLFQHLAGALKPNIFQHLQHASPGLLQHVFNIWLIEVGTALRPSEMT